MSIGKIEMINPINISGASFSDKVLHLIKKHNIPHTDNGNKTIDFYLYFQDKTIGLEAKGQHTEGTVNEKLPHTIYKYLKLDIDEIWLVVHEHTLSDIIKEHIEVVSIDSNVVVRIVDITNLEDMFISNTPKVNEWF